MSAETQAFFVVSSGRSGTAMLHKALSLAGDIEMHHEYMVHIVQPLAVRRYMGLTDAAEAKTVLAQTHAAATRYSDAEHWGDSSNKLSWLVGDLGVQKSAFPGRTNESWMKIDKEGTYYGQCTQICGDRHGYMPIEVHAVSKEKYQQWVDLVLHSTAKDKMRDANEKILGLSYAWMDQPSHSKTAQIDTTTDTASR